AVYRLVARAKREGQWLIRNRFDELLRLPCRVEVMLEPPAFQSRATICEDRDDISCLEANLAFGLLSDKRSRLRRRIGIDGGRAATRSRSRGRRSGCAGVIGSARRRRSGRDFRRLRFHDQRLVAVQHDEREQDSEEDASFHQRTACLSASTPDRRHRIVAMRTKGMTAAQAAKGEPASTGEPVGLERLNRVVRTARHEPAGAAEEWPEKEFITANGRQRDAHAQADVRRWLGNRLQGLSGL